MLAEAGASATIGEIRGKREGTHDRRRFRAVVGDRLLVGRAAGSVPCGPEPGSLGVGASRLPARQSPESIVRSYRALPLADVYAVISRYLANPAPFDDYLHLCDEQAGAVRHEIEAAQGPESARKTCWPEPGRKG